MHENGTELIVVVRGCGIGGNRLSGVKVAGS